MRRLKFKTCFFIKEIKTMETALGIFDELDKILNNRVMYPVFHDDEVTYKPLISSYPYMDVYYTEDENLNIEIALAGYKKDDIKLELDGNFLLITGEYTTDRTKRAYDFESIKKSKFSKKITLPKFYDSEPIVTFESGLLLIVFKKDESKKKKILQIA